MPVELDKEKLTQLLREADDRWFASHSGGYKYSEHLVHTAGYITKNYNRKRGKNGKRRTGSTGEAEGKRKSRRSGKKTPDNQKLLSVPEGVSRWRAKV